VDELQAGVEFALAVLPQPSILLQPSEAALDDPSLGHDLEGVKLTAFGDLHGDFFSQGGVAPPFLAGRVNLIF
jgi:hypothetical protein